MIDDEDIIDIVRNSFNISIITKIECLSWQELSNNKLLSDRAKEFIENATIYELNDKIANQTIENRQKLKIKTLDAIIGATAMIHNFCILTNNINDFKNLDIKVKSLNDIKINSSNINKKND